MKFNDFEKIIFALPKIGGMAPTPIPPTPPPPPRVLGPCLLIYSIFTLFILLYKYNCKIDHKSKSNGNYKKLTNKRKNHRKYRRTKRYKKLSMELRIQILPGLEAKRYKKLRRIIANAGDFTG